MLTWGPRRRYFWWNVASPQQTEGLTLSSTNLHAALILHHTVSLCRAVDGGDLASPSAFLQCDVTGRTGFLSHLWAYGGLGEVTCCRCLDLVLGRTAFQSVRTLLDLIFWFLTQLDFLAALTCRWISRREQTSAGGSCYRKYLLKGMHQISMSNWAVSVWVLHIFSVTKSQHFTKYKKDAWLIELFIMWQFEIQ